MRKHWHENGRFWLPLSIQDVEARNVIKRIEGSRYHPGRQQWSLPATRRTFSVLCRLASEPMTDVGTPPPPDTLESVGPLKIGDRTLFPYQHAGLCWLERRDRALLYDAPGVGKTPQAVAWARNDERVIVVCPLAVVNQWVQEVQVQKVSRSLLAVSRSGKLSERDGAEGAGAGASPKGEWYIMNYERLLKFPFLKLPFTMIVDEATYIKNTKSKRSKSVLEWGDRASRVLALTGMPVVNRPLDLWALFLLMKQRNKSEFWKWAMRYTGPYETKYGWDFSGATHLDELADELSSWALRRTKAEVLPDLPPKLHLKLRAEYSTAQNREIMELARAVLDIARSGNTLRSGEGFATLQELRQESALAKLPFLVDWLNQHFEGGGGKVLVFSSFKEPLRQLEKQTGATLVTGDQEPDERIKSIEGFWGGSNRILGLTYAVGSLGLNLQCAETVVRLDPAWTPLEMEQAEDRAHRVGQKNSVNIIDIIADHPIEAQMFQSLEYKEDIIDGIYTLASRL